MKLMIIFGVIITTLVGIIIFLIILAAIIGYIDKRTWNDGKCRKCGFVWQQYNRDNITIYKCMCPRVWKPTVLRR